MEFAKTTPIGAPKINKIRVPYKLFLGSITTIKKI
jgi:hypothetical protein